MKSCCLCARLLWCSICTQPNRVAKETISKIHEDIDIDILATISNEFDLWKWMSKNGNKNRIKWMSLMRYTLYGMCATIYKNYCFVHTISLSFSFVRFYCRHHQHRRRHCHCCCWLRRSRHEIKSACKLLGAIPFYHQSTLVALLPFHTLHSAAIGWCWLTAWLVDLLLLQYLYVEYFYSWSFAFNEMLSLFFSYLPLYGWRRERAREKEQKLWMKMGISQSG